MAQQDSASPSSDPSPDPSAHLTQTVEQGRFCLASCSCGWQGPARRARSQARKDGDRHTQD
nr:hypothetical protein [Streptomyces sp. LBL]